MTDVFSQAALTRFDRCFEDLKPVVKPDAHSALAAADSVMSMIQQTTKGWLSITKLKHGAALLLFTQICTSVR